MVPPLSGRQVRCPCFSSSVCNSETVVPARTVTVISSGLTSMIPSGALTNLVFSAGNPFWFHRVFPPSTAMGPVSPISEENASTR